MLEHWYRALRAPLGICIKVEGDRELAIQKLYAARREVMDPDLKNLSIVQSPTSSDELWIIKKEGTNDSPEES